MAFNYPKKRKATQAETAKRAGISKAYIGHLENHRPHTTSGADLIPSREKVIAIAKAVNGDINEALELCGYASSKQTLPPEITAIDFTQFSPEDLTEIVNFINFKLSQTRRGARIFHTFTEGTILTDIPERKDKAA